MKTQPYFLISFKKGDDSFIPKEGEGIFSYKLIGKNYGSDDFCSPETLNGNFILVGFDRKAKNWHLWTDRFGTLHAYYAFDGNRAVIGTNFKEVSEKASAKKMDWLGIGGFLRFGFFPDDRTYYEDVKILKPATHSIFSEDGKLISSERYWNWKYEPDYKRSYENTVDEFAQIFHKIIQEQTAEGRVAVPISGGLDSRSTVVAIQNIKPDKKRFWAYSYGYSNDSTETKIAAEIAHAANLPFNSYTIKPYLFEKMDAVIDAVEGFQDVTQARQAFVTDKIKNHADLVICAHWGDVWMDAMIKGETSGAAQMTQDQLTEIIFKKFKKKGSDGLLAIFKDKLPHDLDEQLKFLISKKLKEYDGIQDDDFKIKAFKTDWWSFRWTLASIRVFAAAAVPLLPFYNNRIADFFMTVPTEYVAERKLQIDYLKKYSTQLAKVKWQVYDADLYNYQNFDTWQLPGRILKKIFRVLSGKKVIQRNWETQFLDSEGRENVKKRLIKPGLKIHQWVSAQRLNQEVNNFYGNSEDSTRGYVLSILVTLSAWMENFG